MTIEELERILDHACSVGDDEGAARIQSLLDRLHKIEARKIELRRMGAVPWQTR